MKNLFKLTMLGMAFLTLSGCVYLIVGGMGALGGYVVSPDTVEGITNNDMDSVYDSTVDIISIMGVIQEQTKEGGILIGKVNGCKVTITISSINKNNVKLSVKARKAFFPKISVAQDIFVKIMTHVNE